MTTRGRRVLGGGMLAAGVLLAVVSAGPLGWGLGAVVAVVLILQGWVMLTDRRPEQVRTRRRGEQWRR